MNFSLFSKHFLKPEVFLLSGTCQAHDPDGDVVLNNGVFQPDGTIAVTIIAGTGKWAAFVGAKFQGKTRHSLDGGAVYDFTAVN